MKTTQSRKTPAAAMAGWERVAVVALVVIGAVGWIGARSGLASRREAAELAKQQQAQEIGRLRGDQERLARLVDSGLATGTASAGPVPATAPAGMSPGMAGDSATPAAARSAAMGHLAGLVEKNLLTNPSAILAGRGGADATTVRPAYVIGSDGKLSPRFGELFGLNEPQVARLQETLSVTKQQFEELVTASTTIRPNGENSYTIDVQPNADAANRLREQFVNEFRGVMGDEAYRTFAVLNGERTRDDGTTTGGPTAAFAALGGEAATVTVTRTPTAFQYTMNAGTTRGSGTTTELGRVAERLGPVLQLLPPAFVAPFPARGGSPGDAPAFTGPGVIRIN